MLTFTYRWKIPAIEQNNFVKDWIELTKIAKREYGATEVILYKSEGGDFVAIADWPSAEMWQLWKEKLAHHPMRQRYRAYRIAGPELLFPLVHISDEETK